MKLIAILSLALLTACAQFGAKVTNENGLTMSERAYIAEKQYEAEKACYESRSIAMPDDPTTEQLLGFVVASMAMQNQPSCSGTNHNDVAIAKTKARWGFAGSAARVVGGAYGVGEITDLGKVLANSRVQNTTTYNTEFGGNVTQSASSSLSSGELGTPSTTEGAIRSNSINIGGNVSVAGERSAAGETALVNGDSSVISSVEDSEVKGSDTAEDIDKPNDQSVFNDDDGGNGVFDL